MIMKKVLIPGRNSYIGNRLAAWLALWPEEYQVDKVSLRTDKWQDIDWSGYDSIIHVAGIAHNSSNKSLENLYYSVNRDLTVQVASKAKKEDVRHFVYMSSMIVFGTDQAAIRQDTVPQPDNFYGDSKLQAERELERLESEDFRVAYVRPPMIYGHESKGNYPRLSKLAKVTPLFPDYDNRRSMLHVDNLSEFLRLVIDNQDRGYYHPQNVDYVTTTDLVKEIAKISNHRIGVTKLFNPLIKSMMGINVVNKVFGDLYYEQAMSEYHTNYNVRGFSESVRETELS